MNRVTLALVTLALAIATAAMSGDMTIRTFVATTTVGTETTYNVKKAPHKAYDPSVIRIVSNDTATPTVTTITQVPGDILAAFRIQETAIATSEAQTGVVKFYWDPQTKSIKVLYKDATGTVWLGSATSALVQQ